MGRYVARRLLQFIPVVLGALFLLHYLTTLGIQLNGDPARAYFGDRTPSAAALENLRQAWGIDHKCLSQPGNPCLPLFGERLGVTHFWDEDAPEGYLQGSFGTDFRGREVTTLMVERFPTTIKLALMAVVFVIAVGIITGVWAGLKRGRWPDYLVKASTVAIIAIPVFVLGLITQWFAGVEIGKWVDRQAWLPDLVGDVFTPAYRADAELASLVLPALVLGSINLAYVARLTRTSLVENVRADYVRTAVAKGLRRARVVGVHTLRNSLIPVVTYLGLTLGDLMAGALITEGIFNVPGVGRLVFSASLRGEGPVVISVVTVLVLVYMAANLIVDLLYAVLDPRIRYD